jgi:hypothetical protein
VCVYTDSFIDLFVIWKASSKFVIVYIS